MVENLPCHMHLRIDKRRDAKQNGAEKMAGRIRYAQPFPPYNLTPLNRLIEPTLQRLRRKKELPQHLSSFYIIFCLGHYCQTA